MQLRGLLGTGGTLTPPLSSGGPDGGASTITPGSRTARHDPRWRRIADTLDALRDGRRRAVRIVDADCGCGTLLIEAARYARSVGFTAIEGEGFDGSPALIGRARAAASRLHDPAIGLAFDLVDMIEGLERESELPADIVLWHGNRGENHRKGLGAALAAAGDVVIGDAVSGSVERGSV